MLLVIVDPSGLEPLASALQKRRSSQMSYGPFAHFVRSGSSTQDLVGVPGIEPGPHTPEACILPLYYTPSGPTGSRTPTSSMPWTHSTAEL